MSQIYPQIRRLLTTYPSSEASSPDSQALDLNRCQQVFATQSVPASCSVISQSQASNLDSQSQNLRITPELFSNNIVPHNAPEPSTSSIKGDSQSQGSDIGYHKDTMESITESNI